MWYRSKAVGRFLLTGIDLVSKSEGNDLLAGGRIGKQVILESIIYLVTPDEFVPPSQPKKGPEVGECRVMTDGKGVSTCVWAVGSGDGAEVLPATPMPKPPPEIRHDLSHYSPG